MIGDLIENWKNWNKYKNSLVLGKYVIQTSTKKELMSDEIKIKNYIMTKKIDSSFLDFRPSYFDKFRAKKNILLEQFNELFGDYLIENDYYSINNDYDLVINDFNKDIYIKEIIRDLVIIEFDNKEVMVYFGSKETFSKEELGDYILYEHPQFLIFNMKIITIYSLAELQAYFGITFRQVNTLRILDKIIKLFNRQQKIKKISSEEETFTSLFSKNNVTLLAQYEFDKYLYFNDDFKIKHKDLINVASVGSTGCLTGDTYIDMPRDLIKNPKGIKIEDLVGKKDFYTYTFNIKKNQLELKKVKDVWYSGDKEIFEIETNTGKKIKASANHPFLKNKIGKNNVIESRDYIRCDELKVGEKITTFSRSKKSNIKNGEYIKAYYGKRIVLEHRFIMEELGFELDKHSIVHHKDHNKFNNSINNLKVMNIIEHRRYHTKNSGLYGKDIWKNGEHPKGMLGKKHFNKGNKEPSEFMKTGFKGELYKNISQIGKPKPLNISREEMIEVCRENQKVSYNEKIVKITKLGVEKTYDMEVEDNHNFIANGFIVHNSGKTFTLNLLLLQIIFGGNFKRIIYFDTQDSFKHNIMNNVNPIYLNRVKYLQDNYFKITESSFYLSELDFVMCINFLLETKGYSSGEAKGSVVGVEYDEYEEFKQAVQDLLYKEKTKLSVMKDLNKLEDLESIERFMKKVKVKSGSIFDDLEARKQFFVIFSFQDSLFYEVSTYLYLQKLKDILYSREDKNTYLFTDETQKYLSSAFLRKILLDLVKEKRQFGFRFYFTGLSYTDVKEFIRFAQHIVFNSFNDPYMLNTLKSMTSTPIDSLKSPFEKIVNDTTANKVNKTFLDTNFITKEQNLSKSLLEGDEVGELSDNEKEMVEKQIQKKQNQKEKDFQIMKESKKKGIDNDSIDEEFY